MSRNVARLVSPPRVPYREERFLDAAEAARLIEAARPTPFYPLIALGLATGDRVVRHGVALWQDLDLVRGSIHVRRQLISLAQKGLTLADVKSERSRRVVALHSSAVLLLRSHKEQAEALQAKVGTELDPSAFVFCYPTGRPYSPNTESRAFQQVAKSAGVGGARLHTLRHSHASLLLDQGASLKDIQDRLGHSSIAVTGDLYAHLTEGRQREVAALLESVLDVDTNIRDHLRESGFSRPKSPRLRTRP